MNRFVSFIVAAHIYHSYGEGDWCQIDCFYGRDRDDKMTVRFRLDKRSGLEFYEFRHHNERGQILFLDERRLEGEMRAFYDYVTNSPDLYDRVNIAVQRATEARINDAKEFADLVKLPFEIDEESQP